MEHAKVVELLAVDKWHVGVRVLQGVEPWDNPRRFALGVAGLANRDYRDAIQRVELVTGQFQCGGAFTANAVVFHVLHAGEDHLILQADAFHMGAGLQLEVQAFVAHRAQVFTELSADLGAVVFNSL